MGRVEILEKLDIFLQKHLPFTEECQIVYLLVEIRKVLDQENNRKYPILRFYCNWSVHTEKDPTDEIRAIMNDIYRDVVAQIQKPALASSKMKIVGFMYMEDLQKEIGKFLQEYNLPISLTSNQSNWLALVKLLVKVLSDQPIKNPCADIKKFAFLPATDGCVRGRIDFVKKVGKYDHYNFGNFY